MDHKCLYCYKELGSNDYKLSAGEFGYHQKCSKKIFGSTTPPIIDFTEGQILDLASKIIRSQKTVTGVQPKLSLGLSKIDLANKRFTIVGLYGEYILKPQTEQYENLPENEDLTMKLAKLCKIDTVDHSLIRLKSGQLAYLTKRIDRENGNKLHMEDMCQLTERLTEHKYKGSYEQIAKVIKRFSAYPGIDLINFYEVVLFSFLTGNNDMHLKNFSLIKKNQEYTLCPAYDLVSSELVVEGDDEDLALTLNARKKKIRRKDFEIAMNRSGLNDKVVDNIFVKFEKQIPNWFQLIDNSFLPASTKKTYRKLVLKKAEQLSFNLILV